MTLFNIDLGAWFGTSVQLLLALIAADVLSGIAASLRNGYTQDGKFHPDFQWDKLAQFYVTMILPYLIGYAALALIVKAAVPGQLLGLPFSDSVLTAAWAAIVGAVGKSVVSNLRQIFAPEIFGPVADAEREAHG